MRARFIQLNNVGAEYKIAIAALIAFVAAGFAAAHFMHADGHIITGMTNRVVWGIPHVFALGLILGASGALNVASLSSVFSVAAYKTQTRLSALLAIALLIGGLLVLVLDLGRPDRLAIALTHYNFKSVFAWNIFLYGGFVVIAVVYLWFEFERRFNRHTRTVGGLAFAWRFILTGGSGAIFALLIARPAYHSAIVIPLFIALSLSIGGATFMLLSTLLSRWNKNYSSAPTTSLARLLGWFAVAAFCLTAALHLTNFYFASEVGKRAMVIFFLRDGGVYTLLTWFHLIVGGVLPIVLLLTPRFRTSARARITAATAIIIGAFAQLYTFIIGGQVLPVVLFPGSTVTGGFYDGVIATYSPSLPEWLLGFGGVAVALLIVLTATRVLPFLPNKNPASAIK